MPKRLNREIHQYHKFSSSSRTSLSCLFFYLRERQHPMNLQSILFKIKCNTRRTKTCQVVNNHIACSKTPQLIKAGKKKGRKISHYHYPEKGFLKIIQTKSKIHPTIGKHEAGQRISRQLKTCY